MRPRDFVAPNFLCKLTPTPEGVKGGLKDIERLEHGDNEEEVRQRIAKLYPKHALVVERYDFKKRWLDRARKATQELVEARNQGEKDGYKDGVWGSLREYLFRLFDDRCAYCDGARAGVTVGAVEHYRPKSGVDGTDHPGYYWLAYDHENYLPACGPCNNSKGTQFPLEDEAKRVRAPAPDPFDKTPLAVEAPKLPNAWNDHPSKDMTFEIDLDETAPAWTPRTVMARPLSARAEEAIAVLSLNRESLMNERAVEAGNIVRAFAIEMNFPSQVVIDLQAGRRRFSASGLLAIREFLKKKADLLG